MVLAGMPAAGAKSLATRFTSNVWLERPAPGAGGNQMKRKERSSIAYSIAYHTGVA